MIAIYAVVLTSGVIALGWWIVAERQQGQGRRASLIRRSITGATAFGLAGMSASYGGVNDVLTPLLAVAAAIGLVLYSDRVTE